MSRDVKHDEGAHHDGHDGGGLDGGSDKRDDDSYGGGSDGGSDKRDSDNGSGGGSDSDNGSGGDSDSDNGSGGGSDSDNVSGGNSDSDNGSGGGSHSDNGGGGDSDGPGDKDSDGRSSDGSGDAEDISDNGGGGDGSNENSNDDDENGDSGEEWHDGIAGGVGLATNGTAIADEEPPPKRQKAGYCLAEVPASFRAELVLFEEHRTIEINRLRARSACVPVTAANDVANCLCFMGWLVEQRRLQAGSDLLSSVFGSCKIASLAEDWLASLQRRQIKATTQAKYISSVFVVTSFVFEACRPAPEALHLPVHPV